MSLATAQTAKSVEYYEIVHLDVGDGYRLTNAPFDITYLSNTYTSFGMLLGFDTIEENSELEIPSLNITISGIAPTSSGSALKDFIGENYANSSVQIDRVYYENHQQQGVVNVYKGYITGADLLQSANDVSNVLVKTASHWHDFARQTGHRTNTNSQQKRIDNNSTQYATTDTGFSFSLEVQKEITWKA